MKSTEELVNEIKASTNVDAFVNKNKDNFVELSLSQYLQSMLEAHNTDKSTVLANADMKSNNYGYEVFYSDKKSASRDKIIQLAFGFPLTLNELQLALKHGKASPLYARNRRDSLIMFALHNKYTIGATNELLESKGEKLLY